LTFYKRNARAQSVYPRSLAACDGSQFNWDFAPASLRVQSEDPGAGHGQVNGPAGGGCEGLACRPGIKNRQVQNNARAPQRAGRYYSKRGNEFLPYPAIHARGTSGLMKAHPSRFGSGRVDGSRHHSRTIPGAEARGDRRRLSVGGEVRPLSQLPLDPMVQLIDLLSLSVVTLAIDRWEVDRCQCNRRGAAVRRGLGPQSRGSLRMPPFGRRRQSLSPAYIGGAGQIAFPAYALCVKCLRALVGAHDLGARCKGNRFRPERRSPRPQTNKGLKGDQPAKDVTCPFLDGLPSNAWTIFPWHYFTPSITQGSSGCKGTLHRKSMGEVRPVRRLRMARTRVW